MKKLTLLAMMALVMLGFTQCKKENPAATKMVDVTFTAARGDAKTSISPLGVVEFVAGDKIHVYGASSGYHGYLTFVSGAKGGEATFSGTISEWTDGETLRFFYIGSGNDSKVATDGSVNINFADQSYTGVQSEDNDLLNIAHNFHVSRYEQADVSTDVTNFSGELKNMMALGCYNTSAFTDGTYVKLYAYNTNSSGTTKRLKNMIVISSQGEIQYQIAGIRTETDYQAGHIITGPASAKRFVALLPWDEETPAVINLRFTSNNMSPANGMATTVSVNSFIHDGNYGPIAAPTPTTISNSSYVDLAVASDHTFSVSSSKTVKFAKGNLVYNCGRFKMHSEQYGRIWTDNATITSYLRVYQTFDYFQWGTSCWDNGNMMFMPYNRDNDNFNGSNFGPKVNGSIAYNLYDETTHEPTNADWGKYQFGMNASSLAWRTMTATEWEYLINRRRNCSTIGGVDNARYVKAKVNEVTGLIIFPDSYQHPADIADPVGINEAGVDHWNNDDPELNNAFSLEDWQQMEIAGAVFLPAAGERVSTAISSNGTAGYYWSSTYHPTYSQYAYGLMFCDFSTNNRHEVNANYDDMNRVRHCSVRLVVDAN